MGEHNINFQLRRAVLKVYSEAAIMPLHLTLPMWNAEPGVSPANTWLRPQMPLSDTTNTLFSTQFSADSPA